MVFSFVVLVFLLMVSACGFGAEEDEQTSLAYSTYDGAFLKKPGRPFSRFLDPPKKLTGNPADVMTWDPSGKKLAFFHGNSLEVTDGKAHHRYLSDDVWTDYETSPSWSPDGRRIAYSCFKDAGYSKDYSKDYSDSYSNVCVVDVASGKESLLTDAPGSDVAPVFSPEGSKVAFVSERNDRSRFSSGKDADLYLMDADGSHETRITRTRDIGYDLAWFPNGRRLAVWRRTSRNIYTVDLDDPKTIPLTRGAFYLMRFFTPSPDGRKLAFLFDGRRSVELHVTDVNGENEKVLAKGLAEEGPPSWSPDGRKIAYQTYGDNTGSDIMAVGLNGSKPEKLFSRDGYTTSPAWRPH